MNLPLWQFGKARVADGAKRGEYRVLASAPDFTDEQQAILRRITENASWCPCDGSGCAPALACWPLGGDDWLLLRFIDDGIDDHYRPNTMRIEAALMKNMSWERVCEFLTPEAWPVFVSDGVTSIDLAPHPRVDENRPRPVKPVLCADSDGLSADLFEVPFDDKRILKQEPRSLGENVGPTRTIPGHPSPTRGSKGKLAWIVAVVILVVVVLYGAIYIISQNNTKISTLETENKELKNHNRKLEDQINAKDVEISRLEKEKENLHNRIRDLLPADLREGYGSVMESLKETEEKLNDLRDKLSNIRSKVDAFGESLQKNIDNAMKQAGKQE